MKGKNGLQVLVDTGFHCDVMSGAQGTSFVQSHLCCPASPVLGP